MCYLVSIALPLAPRPPNFSFVQTMYHDDVDSAVRPTAVALSCVLLHHRQATKLYLDALLPPVLHCLDDAESRVRYYACESLYNIAKVSILRCLVHRAH